ncbi:MAG: hypothetical protein KAZ94_04525 [Burkholderiales bacterium]|jgi:hypothetical protein|nr:hypothetical protein [Burkholderiales bacterium]MBP9769686.1 hypothetical protein [Burkholderiales bacterium]
MKKSIIAIALILVAVSIAYCSSDAFKNAALESSSSSSLNSAYAPKSIDLSKINWLQRYPQLKNIPANSQTATIDKLRTSESISALIGPIDNPYGVRNDILDAILTIVPKDNLQMLHGAIQEAYYDNLSIYSKSDKDKLFYVRKSSLAMGCLFQYDVSDNNIFAGKVVDEMGDKMRNTDAREERVHHLETTVFAWQMLGSGLDDQTERELCQSGEY